LQELVLSTVFWVCIHVLTTIGKGSLVSEIRGDRLSTMHCLNEPLGACGQSFGRKLD
jgi:hypothetical protein